MTNRQGPPVAVFKRRLGGTKWHLLRETHEESALAWIRKQVLGGTKLMPTGSVVHGVEYCVVPFGEIPDDDAEVIGVQQPRQPEEWARARQELFESEDAHG